MLCPVYLQTVTIYQLTLHYYTLTVQHGTVLGGAMAYTRSQLQFTLCCEMQQLNILSAPCDVLLGFDVSAAQSDYFHQLTQVLILQYSKTNVMQFFIQFINFSATRILPSSYLFWTGKRLVDYL
jgi:hypothetical protein